VSRCFIDHIAVTAPSLAVGAAYVQGVLGVSLQPGGEHPQMGTHNLLLRLGESVYLEVIAPNPAAPAPTRPRWFALDTLGPRSAPAIATWVVRTVDIRATLGAASEELGTIEAMRRGTLNWLISLTSDGSLPLGGAAPALIQWHTDAHPAATLPDLGVSLAKLEIFHPDPGRVARLLRSLKLEAPVCVAAPEAGAVPRLVAHLNTPQGIRLLSAPPA
jgi:hypothetical protein